MSMEIDKGISGSLSITSISHACAVLPRGPPPVDINNHGVTPRMCGRGMEFITDIGFDLQNCARYRM